MGNRNVPLWPSRVLWLGVGSVLQLALTTVILLAVSESPDTVAAWGSVVTAIATVGLLAAAVWAGRVAVKTMEASRLASNAAQIANKHASAASKAMKRANAQAEQDSKNVNRPYVAATLVPGLAGPSTFDLKLHNYGRAAAWELTVGLDESLDSTDDISDAVLEMMKTPRTLFPGQSVRTMWSIAAASGRNLESGRGDSTLISPRAGMPPQAILHLQYYHEGYGQSAIEDSTPIFDVIVVRADRSGNWPVPEDGTEVKGVRPTLSNFYALGRAISRHLGNLAR